MADSGSLFAAVAARDYDKLASLYATNASQAILSFLSAKSRWSFAGASEGKGEEKLDEFLELLADKERMFSDSSASKTYPFSRHSNYTKSENDQSYYLLLKELVDFVAERSDADNGGGEGEGEQPPKKTKICDLSADAERLLRDAATIFSDSRPPSDFVVYPGQEDDDDNDDNEEQHNPSRQPIFDGAVANATPPALGGPGFGASGGTGTILHVACALDVPLALAFLLAMGADARASHTAFRRLMIHEAACNGSIQCLTLLLELGQRFGAKDLQNDPPISAVSRSTSTDFDLAFFPRRIERSDIIAPLQTYVKHARFFGRKLTPDNADDGRDFMSTLRLFREYSKMVEMGTISELDAARKVLEHAKLSHPCQASLARSCGFFTPHAVPRNFMRPFGGTSDGHGNTPLHWAAFKNEIACVDLLLKFNADPNARAHPSGWTPLHDAAYSNSKETIELLLDAGGLVDARANSGATPLCFAAQEDSADATELLLQRGADLTIRCAVGPVRDDGSLQAGVPHSRFSGYTPLHYAAHYNAERSAKMLLAHSSARIAMDTADLSERLPIHVAVARGSADVLRELLHAGARVETRFEEEGKRDGRRRTRTSDSSTTATSSSSTEPDTPTRPFARQMPPSPEGGITPRSPAAGSDRSGTATPVSSPLLRSMIPAQPIQSSKPWNCLTQRSINECRQLISEAESSWAPDRHLLFTPNDRQAVRSLLLVGKRLEQSGAGIYIDLWPQVLTFCGRGWFDPDDGNKKLDAADGESSVLVTSMSEESDDAMCLALPNF